MRATHNSNPLNPHVAVARLPGSFDSISHDANQPLERDIQTHLATFSIHADGDLATAHGPRVAVSAGTVLRTGFGLFTDLLPGSVADLVGVNPPYVNTFRGGLLGTVGGTASRPESRAARWMPRLRRTRVS